MYKTTLNYQESPVELILFFQKSLFLHIIYLSYIFFCSYFSIYNFFYKLQSPPYTSPRVCLGPILGKSPQLLSVVYLVLISIHLPHLHSKYKTNNIQSSNRKNLIFGYLGDSNNISS